MGHYATSCPGQGGGGGGQDQDQGNGQYNSYSNFAGNGSGKKAKNPRTGNAEPKTCPSCGHVGRHPVKSNCPMKKTKQVKKNAGGGTPDYDGGYEY